jgi:hypothetical protein
LREFFNVGPGRLRVARCPLGRGLGCDGAQALLHSAPPAALPARRRRLALATST